jgi:hypothetical protein
MKLYSRCLIVLPLALFLLGPTEAAGAVPAPTRVLLDDFSDAQRNSKGIQRLLFDDKAIGGQSRARQKCEKGVLAVEGELIPARGSPAYISLVSLLSLDGKTYDLSDYQGVRLRVKINQGTLSVQVGSSEIQNYDFHAGSPMVRKPEFQEMRIPFSAMKRGWSEQTPLNLKTVTSVNLVAVALAKDTFSYEVDEIGFY